MLEKLIFWVSPLSQELFVGTPSKRDPQCATQKREITGLMVNGIVEWMLARGYSNVEVTQHGKRYRLSVEEVEP